MTNLTQIQRRMLANLEEAGEETVTALLNVVMECQETAQEVETYRKALADLVNRDLVKLAYVRDEHSLRWMPLQKSEAAAIIAELQRFIEWHSGDGIWIWTAREPLPEVLTTDEGNAAAKAILSQDGWDV